MKLVTTTEMRAIESQADSQGHTYAQMMELAGEGLAQEVIRAYPDLPDRSALGLVGTGNNGGDTLVALEHLADAGWRVSAYLVKPRPDDPLVDRVHQAGGEVFSAEDDKKSRRLAALLGDHAVVLDGILGTGVELPLRGEAAQVLEAAQEAMTELEHPPFVVAVDCPSGVDTDSGAAAPQALPAGLTVTMAAVKMGMLRFPAFPLVGEVRVVDIGLPADLEPWEAVRREVADANLVSSWLPQRPLDAHKGTFGTALVVAGSVNYSGAALLAAEAAYRVGTGLVTLAVPTPLHNALAGHLLEATWLLLPHEVGVIAENAAEVLRDHLPRATAVVLGPGFGLEDSTRNFMARILGAAPGIRRGMGIGFVRSEEAPEIGESASLPPLVIDADGLKLLAKIPRWAELLPAPAILTPHPGEMAVLTGMDVPAIQEDRLAAAEQHAAEWGHIVVLKGAITVVAAPDGRTALIAEANPALARAGTGDVLTGLIAGFRAQGLEAYPAAVAGAWLHAQAGKLAASFLGNTSSVLAGDVLAAVPDVLTDLA